MGFQAWVSSETGLPSFRLSGAGVLKAGERVIARVESGALECSDALAPVDQYVDYSFAGQGARLTRKFPRGEVPGEHKAIVTALNGRGVVVDFYEDVEAPEDFQPSVTEYANGVVRFSGVGERKGRSRLVLDGPGKLAALRGVLEHRGLVLIALGGPAAGVDPVLCVLVDRVQYRRVSTVGEFEVDVDWKVKPVPEGALAAPAVTWGEAERAGFTWTPGLSYSSLARTLGGAP